MMMFYDLLLNLLNNQILYEKDSHGLIIFPMNFSIVEK